MIKVLIKYSENQEFISLKIKGHANSGPYGHDLVCAATSGIVLGGINNLQGKYNLEQDENNGVLELTSLDKVSSHDSVVLETIIKQLEMISEAYPKNIKISVE